MNQLENLGFINVSAQELLKAENRDETCVNCSQNQSESTVAAAPKKQLRYCNLCETFLNFKSACSKLDYRKVDTASIETLYQHLFQEEISGDNVTGERDVQSSTELDFADIASCIDDEVAHLISLKILKKCKSSTK